MTRTERKVNGKKKGRNPKPKAVVLSALGLAAIVAMGIFLYGNFAPEGGKANLQVGQSRILKVFWDPGVTWNSSDSLVADVVVDWKVVARVRAKGTGTAEISASFGGKVVGRWDIVVASDSAGNAITDVDAVYRVRRPANDSLKVGQRWALVESEPKVRCISSRDSVATIGDGCVIEACGEGVTTIGVYFDNVLLDSMTLTVAP